MNAQAGPNLQITVFLSGSKWYAKYPVLCNKNTNSQTYLAFTFYCDLTVHKGLQKLISHFMKFPPWNNFLELLIQPMVMVWRKNEKVTRGCDPIQTESQTKASQLQSLALRKHNFFM